MLDKNIYRIINGNSLDILDTLEENSVDSIVTDPPYELGFMGKSWDASGIAYNVELWKKALRVLKPGGYLLAFGGTRTYHRICCAIEDAGFENRERQANYKYIGIELDPEYCKISEARIDYAINKYEYDIIEAVKENEKKGQLSLFDFNDD